MRATPSKTPDSSSRLRRATPTCSALGLGALLALGACKKDEPTCKPEDKSFAMVRLVVQPAPQINVDPEGTPQATTVRLYQLKGGRSLDVPLDFQQVWKDGGEAFGDELLKDEELTIYPDKPDVFEIEPEADATHFVAVAIFREPVGSSWYAEWEVPQYHGYSVCAAEEKKQPYEDPCFLLFMEGSVLEGGHKPPPGMDADAIPMQCPPPPLKVKPKPPEEGKKKKRKKGKGKEKAEGAADKGADAQDKAAGAQETSDKAQGAGEAVSDPPVPGK